MRRLTSPDPKRQELWLHNGLEYSIIDLGMFPLERNGTRYESPRIDFDLAAIYRPYIYEVAVFNANNGKGIDIVGRYKTKQEARQAVRTIKIGEKSDLTWQTESDSD